MGRIIMVKEKIPTLSYEHFSEVMVNVNDLQLIIPSEHLITMDP